MYFETEVLTDWLFWFYFVIDQGSQRTLQETKDAEGERRHNNQLCSKFKFTPSGEES